ncbi:MAG TPA: maleylpyruvate isomerase N-terminal domain-containing protein [Microlunatus sp.]
MSQVGAQAALFAQAARTVANLVGTIPTDAWGGPGLGEWDLRALVGHTSRALLTVETYLRRPAEQEDQATAAAYVAAGQRLAAEAGGGVAQRGRDAGEALGPRPAEAFAAIVARVLPQCQRADDPVIATIAGGMRLSVYLETRTFELVVHGVDIADALGVAPPAFGFEVWRAALDVAAGVVAYSDEAPVVVRALTGRAELPPGFSIV